MPRIEDSCEVLLAGGPWAGHRMIVPGDVLSRGLVMPVPEPWLSMRCAGSCLLYHWTGEVMDDGTRVLWYD